MTKSNTGGQGESELPPPDFPTFIISLWTTALYQLGQLPDPSTGQPVAADRIMASQNGNRVAVRQPGASSAQNRKGLSCLPRAGLFV